MKRKLLSILLSACMAVSMIPLGSMGAFAHDYSEGRSVYFFSDSPTFVIGADGSLWGWGSNYYNSIGNGKSYPSEYKNGKWDNCNVLTPYRILDNVRSFYLGQSVVDCYSDSGIYTYEYYIPYAIKEDNSLWVWGYTAQLVGLTSDYMTSTPVKYADNVKECIIDTYSETEYNRKYDLMVYLVTTNGELLALGDNQYGELGNGTKNRLSQFTKIMDDVEHVEIVEGEPSFVGNEDSSPKCTYVIKKDGSLWCWGDGDHGINLSSSGKTITPVKVMDNIKFIGDNSGTGYVVTNNDELYIWGNLPHYFEGARAYIYSGVWANTPNQWYTGTPCYVTNDVKSVYTMGYDFPLFYLKNNGDLYMEGNDVNNVIDSFNNSDTYGTLIYKVMSNVKKIQPSEAGTLASFNLIIFGNDGNTYMFDATQRDTAVEALKSPTLINESSIDSVTDSDYGFGMGTHTTLITKTDGTVWGTGLDLDGHGLRLMGKGNQENGKYVKLFDGARTSSYVPKETVGGLSDVFDTDYYADAVVWAVDNNITSGTGGNTFSPKSTCSRAQAVTFLWRAAGSPEPEDVATPFKDVPSGSYYQKAVSWALENDITSGTGADTFSPDAVCDRAQIVTYLYRSAGAPEVTESSSFNDVGAGAYYADAVDWAVSKGITTGTDKGSFSPSAQCTRAQIVTFLYRSSNSAI